MQLSSKLTFSVDKSMRAETKVDYIVFSILKITKSDAKPINEYMSYLASVLETLICRFLYVSQSI